MPFIHASLFEYPHQIDTKKLEIFLQWLLIYSSHYGDLYSPKGPRCTFLTSRP